MRLKFLLPICMLASACEYFSLLPFDINDDGHWEVIEIDNGYQPPERWTFEDGALVEADTIAWCRCSEQGRRNEIFNYAANEIVVTTNTEGTYVLQNNEQHYRFNPNGSLASVTDNGVTQNFEYDETGGLIEINVDGRLGIRAERNAQGKIVRLFDDEGLTTSAQYNELGEVVLVDTGNGINRYTYDEQRRLKTNTAIRSSGPTYTSTYVYNDNSTLAHVEVTRDQNEFRSRTEYTYDVNKRLIRKEFIQEGDASPFVNTYAYDEHGRLSQTQYSQFGVVFSDHQIEYRALDESRVEVLVSDKSSEGAFVGRTLWQRFEREQKRPPASIPRLSIDLPTNDLHPSVESAFNR